MGWGQAPRQRSLVREGLLPPTRLEENWGNLVPCSQTMMRGAGFDGC